MDNNNTLQAALAEYFAPGCKLWRCGWKGSIKTASPCACPSTQH
jgi:hypothetical protein